MLENGTRWKKYMTYIRDGVFIILFITSVIGWIRAEIAKKNNKDIQYQILIQRVDDLIKHQEKTNDILREQQILNGKVIQYMEMR